MYYIIFDLEWNNVYNYKTQKGMNEIIEIGAVKLNERLDVVDTFKQLIAPRITKKLSSNFKRLTHITLDEIRENGIDFDDAFADFTRWSGNDCVFLSWSNSDLYTLVDNYKRFKNTCYVDFIKRYADAQSYCMQFIDDHNGNQISLSNCAEKFEIEADTSVLHRALEDCYLTTYCLRKVFDKEKFKEFVCDCNVEYFERLVYKPYFLSNKNKNLFDVNKVELICPNCCSLVRVVNNYEFNNNTFRNAGVCTECNKKYWVYIRAKKTYDDVVVSQRLVPINKKRAKHIN